MSFNEEVHFDSNAESSAALLKYTGSKDLVKESTAHTPVKSSVNVMSQYTILVQKRLGQKSIGSPSNAKNLIDRADTTPNPNQNGGDTLARIQEEDLKMK